MKYNQALHFARALRKNQTKEELFLWKHIRKRQLKGFRFNRQFIIKHQNSERNIGYFIVDFYCHEKLLIIEIDGPIHNLQRSYDRLREKILRAQGFNIIRFTNSEINSCIDTVLVEIENVLLD